MPQRSGLNANLSVKSAGGCTVEFAIQRQQSHFYTPLGGHRGFERLERFELERCPNDFFTSVSDWPGTFQDISALID